VECDNNQLTSLNVNGATDLRWVYCNTNQLTSLDVGGAPALGKLYCSNNQLTSLDLSQNIYLSELICQSNQLTCLNIKNTQLLDPTYVHLTSGVNNPLLACIGVDDVALVPTPWPGYLSGWGFDSTASFSTNCNNPCSSATTGMAEHEIIDKTAEHGLSLTLYPNPVASYLAIETEHPSTINLYNTQGQLLLDKKISATYTLNTSGLSRGIYLLKVTDEQGRVYSQKIIKE